MPRKNKGAHIKFRKDRDCWEVVEYISGQIKRHATGFGRRDHAEEKLAEIIFLRSNPIKNQDDGFIGNLIAYYAKEHVPILSRPDVALANMERLIPFWSEIKLSEIRQSVCFEYYDYRKLETERWQKKYGRPIKELSKSSVRRELEQLQAIINFSHKNNITTINPFVYKFEKSRPRDRWMTRKEVAGLLWEARKIEQARDYLPLFVLLGIYTGQRMGVILKLKWADVDLNLRIIDFTKYDKSKTKRSAKVRIHRKLLGHLNRAKKRGLELGYVIHRDQNPIKSPKKSFKNACRRAGLVDVTINTMRHTAASWLMQKNVSSPKIAKHLGHSNARMVESTYGHLSADYMDEVMSAYD